MSKRVFPITAFAAVILYAGARLLAAKLAELTPGWQGNGKLFILDAIVFASLIVLVSAIVLPFVRMIFPSRPYRLPFTLNWDRMGRKQSS